MTKLHAKMVLNNICVSRFKMSAVGNDRSSFTFYLNLGAFKHTRSSGRPNTFSSKTFIVCDRDNNHGICRLGLTISPLEITLENVGNANITLGGKIQLCELKSTLITAKLPNIHITNSNPLKWSLPPLKYPKKH